MKIQCSCGAKYAFDVSPEMAQTPVRFVCPACGVDASDLVNHLIRHELGLPQLQSAPVPTPVAVAAPQRCSKHPDQLVTSQCHICSKPLCPKCMELFGYLCSPLCKAKAQAQGIAIPVYAGQKAVREARTWRRTVAVAGTLCGLLVAALGFWFWYAWFASVPKTVWSVRFAQPAYAGQSAFCGKDQIVVLHGDTLARYDLKLKQEIWSRHLLDKTQIDAAVARQTTQMQAAIDKANSDDPDHLPRMPDPDKLRENAQRAAEQALDLRVRGQNIWVLSPGKLTRYDRDAGNPVKEIPLPAAYGGLVPRGDELFNLDLESEKPTLTRINLNTCETRTEDLGRPALAAATTGRTDLADAKLVGGATDAAKLSAGKAGLPIGTPGRGAGKVMDPKKVADQAQHLSLPARIALPAVLAHNLNQERTLAAYDDHPPAGSSAAPPEPEPATTASLIPAQNGFLQFSVNLLESRMVTRDAMKPASAGSVLNGNLTVANTPDLANEILNEGQRARGGQVVREDASRYQVTIRRSDAPNVWSGEVIGRPSLFPLTTVNVLTANKSVLVLDQSNQKLWQAALSYNVSRSSGGSDPENARYGLGPCVERQDTLYVIDEGVLTAFDLATGNARWRLPSVGVTGLFFDDEGMIYLNTSTASPDTLKYPNQIDITRKDSAIVVKLEPRTGKVLWNVSVGGLVNYVSGKFIYSVYCYHADDNEDTTPFAADSLLGRESVLSIKRLNPNNGRVLWEHVQKRVPLDIQFDQNTIRLVFKREVQVLKFLAL